VASWGAEKGSTVVDSKSLMKYEGKFGNRTKFPLDFYNKVCYNS